MSMIFNSVQVLAQNDGTAAQQAAGTNICTIDATGLTMGAALPLKQGTSVIHPVVPIAFPLVAATVSNFAWLFVDGLWQLASVSVYFQTGSTSGTLQLTRDTGTNAPGAGTVQLTGTISLAAASQQLVLPGTVIASPTTFGPGDRLGILIAGTMTSLANGIGVAQMRRIA